MKPKLYILSLLLLTFVTGSAQITTPVTRAGFGIDADLRANFFNGGITSSGDDWFARPSASSGRGIIDTTGATNIVNGYSSNPASRMYSFYRPMGMRPYSTVNNMLLLDALFYRDFHGDDSTVYASGSNKNGMSPANWSCPVSQNIPDKNDILDAFTHIRRDGPSVTDSLWLFGGISIQNTTGNRYFDFELYQTDITYNRSTRTFSGYGAEAGHTAWLFDAAGNVLRAGDIIFSAEYSSSSLTLVEARIWVHSSSLSAVTPVNFNWGGQFDGANSGAAYGYASITPKTAGNFYTGLQCAPGVWAGPFSLVQQDNSITTTYVDRQFMEFSVNLTKLGLDPAVFGSNPCAAPFRRMIIKSRASTSFTAELKDFIVPFRMFNYPPVNAYAYINYQCVTFHPTTVEVINPSPDYTYTWSTPNGIIIGSNTGPVIMAGAPGNYIVTQRLNALCPVASSDTVLLMFDAICMTLQLNFTNVTVREQHHEALVSWQVGGSGEAVRYIVEKSYDGRQFTEAGQVAASSNGEKNGYSYSLPLDEDRGRIIYYRIKAITKDDKTQYSKMVLLKTGSATVTEGLFYPNPAWGDVWFEKELPATETALLEVWDANGARVTTAPLAVRKGVNKIKLDCLNGKPRGFYLIKIKCAGETITGKVLVMR